VDFCFEAINKKRPFFTLGIGKSYLAVKLSARDNFNEVICSCPFTTVRDKSTYFSFTNPMDFFIIKVCNEIIREVPVIKDYIGERNTFRNSIFNKFSSEFYFRFKRSFIGRDERIIFRYIRFKINGVRFFGITIGGKDYDITISDNIFSWIMLNSDRLEMLSPFFAASIINRKDTIFRRFSSRIMIKNREAEGIKKFWVPFRFRDEILEILIRGVRDFIKDRRYISSFIFDKETGEVKGEGEEERFREEMPERVNKFGERERILCYNLYHGKPPIDGEERRGNNFSLPFLEDYSKN